MAPDFVNAVPGVIEFMKKDLALRVLCMKFEKKLRHSHPKS